MAIKAVFYFNDGNVTVHSENTKDVNTRFKAGYYNCHPNRDSIAIKEVEFKEVHEPFPNQRSSEIIDAVTKFLNRENMMKCNDMGFTYKMNVLLHGKQGVGKTSLMNYVCDMLVKKHDAIIFRIDNMDSLEVSWMLAEEIRQIQENPIVFVIDEFEVYATNSREAYMKNLLDGNRSINNSMVFASTNYLDRVPKTIKERPSRFRVVSEIEPINDKEVIKNLIVKTHNKCRKPFLTEEQINSLVDKVQDTTVDQIKTAMVDVLMDISINSPEGSVVGFKPNEKESYSDVNDEDTAFEELLERFSNGQRKALKELASRSNIEVPSRNNYADELQQAQKNSPSSMFNTKSDIKT